jgi:hypothetical protein
MERDKNINVKLSKYVEFWKHGIKIKRTYAMKMNLYVDNWEDVLLHLSKPLPAQRSTFLEGFWPSNNYKLNYAKVELPSTKPKLLIWKTQSFVLYCGPKNLKLIPAYTPFIDLNNENFVLVKPHDPFLIPI